MCRVAQSILQLIIGMVSARYLGPKNYGLINYAASIVAFVLPVTQLGFNATMVHELIENPKNEGKILGSALVMNLISSFFCIIGVTFFALIVNAGEEETILVCVLYSLSLVFSALETIKFWFQYKLKSKYPSIIMLISYVIVSAYKIFLLVSGKNVYWFALINCLDYGIISLSLIFLYKKIGKGKFVFSFSCAKSLISRSKYYILSAIMVVVFQTTDHIMLTTMIGQKENGYYTAALTSITVLQFVYHAIIDSYRPLILSNKKENQAEYEKNISSLYSVILYLSFAQSIVFFIFAPLIVSILYGSDYSNSVAVLRVLVWYFSFSLMGTVRNVWILAEQKQKFLMTINLFGAIVNVILNALLIPFYGAGGAAFASFSTQVFTNFILGFLIKSLKQNNRLMLKGLNPKFALTLIKYLFRTVFLRKSNTEGQL